MEIWTGFIFGLIGSFHCVGMCGPIAIALPGGFRTKWSLTLSRLLYNSGRIITYGLLGIVAGIVGEAIALAGWQQTLSIVMGSLILLSIIIPYILRRSRFNEPLLVPIKKAFSRVWAKLMSRRSFSSLFLIGLLNGFLPCGFVYIALAAAASTGTTINSISYMLLFGLGTTPIMLATSLFGQFLPQRVKHSMVRLLPVAGLVLGCLLVLRGMSLGIPYVSPLVETNIQATTEPGCCSK